VELFGNGNLDISDHDAPGVTIGSIEGDGFVLLGANELTVGTNRLSTIFSGSIRDGGISGGSGGSLIKTGKGKLTLRKASTYTGGTTIKRGTLLIRNTSGSGTGPGTVQVEAGTLGGTGKIAGAVTIGTKSGPGAVLAPGRNAVSPRTLTIQSSLTFNSDATYNLGLNSISSKADQVVASGVTISDALFSAFDLGGGVLSQGAAFTVISNTAATPVAGTFANLPDGSTFTVGLNTFQASYEGGDGNDLTLTVVP